MVLIRSKAPIRGEAIFATVSPSLESMTDNVGSRSDAGIEGLILFLTSLIFTRESRSTVS